MEIILVNLSNSCLEVIENLKYVSVTSDAIKKEKIINPINIKPIFLNIY